MEYQPAAYAGGNINQMRFVAPENLYDHFRSCEIFIYSFFFRGKKLFASLDTDQNRSNLGKNRFRLAADFIFWSGVNLKSKSNYVRIWVGSAERIKLQKLYLKLYNISKNQPPRRLEGCSPISRPNWASKLKLALNVPFRDVEFSVTVHSLTTTIICGLLVAFYYFSRLFLA